MKKETYHAAEEAFARGASGKAEGSGNEAKEDTRTPFEEFVDEKFVQSGVSGELVKLAQEKPQAETEIHLVLRKLMKLRNEIRETTPSIVKEGKELKDLKKLEDSDYIAIEQGKAEDPVSFWINEKINESGIYGKLLDIKKTHPETDFEVDSIIRRIGKMRAELEKQARYFIEQTIEEESA